jgi:hypothetical protein
MNQTMMLVDEAAQLVEYKPVISGGQRRMVRAEPPHACRMCGERRSRFFIRGSIKADRSHTLCFECYRRVVNRARAQRQRPAGLGMLTSSLPVPAGRRGDPTAFYADLNRRRVQAILAARHAADGVNGMARDEAAGSLGEVLQKVS